MNDEAVTPAPPPKGRRILRWGLITTGALLSLVVLLLVFIDTGPGHRLLRSVATEVLNEHVLNGRLSVRDIEGSLYGDFSISGLRIEDSKGRTAVEVERIRVAYALGALRRSIVHVELVEIIRPSVLIAEEEDGQLNLATLVRPSAPEPPPETTPPPSSLVARLERFHLESGRVRFVPKEGAPREVTGLELDVSGSVAPGAIEVAVSKLELDLVEPPLPVRAHASAKIGPSSARASIDLEAGEASLRSDGTDIVLDTGAASGRVHLSVPHTLFRRLGLDPMIVGDVELELRLSEGTKLAPWKVDLEGNIAGAPVQLDGLVGPTQGEVELSLEGLNPRRVHELAPSGAIDLSARANFPRWDRGRADLDLRGELELLGQRLRVGTLTATASIDGARAEVGVDLEVVPRKDQSQEGRLSTNARAVLRLSPTLEVESSSVSVVAAELASLAHELAPVRGVVKLDAQAHGPATDLSISAKVRTDRLQAHGLSLGRGEIDAEVSRVPSAPEGKLELRFLDLKADAFSFSKGGAHVSMRDGGRRAHLNLEADGAGFLRHVALTASTAQSAEATRVDLTALRVDTASASWSMAPTQLSITRAGLIEIAPMILSSAAGTLRVEGQIAPARWTDGTMKLEVEALDLGALAGFSPSLESLSGQVDLRTEFRPGRTSPSLRLELDATRLRRFQGGPLSVSTKLDLKERKLIFDTRLEGGDAGLLVLHAKGTTPRRLDDFTAWKDPKRLESLSARFDAVSLGRIAALTSTTSLIEGRIDGNLAIEAGMENAKVAISIRDLAAAGRRLPADTTLVGIARPEQIDLTLTSTLAGTKPIRVEIETNVGTRVWLTRGAEAALEAGAELHLLLANLPATVVAALAGLSPDDPRFSRPRGLISVAVDARGGSKALELNSTVSLFRFAMAEKAPELDLEFVASLSKGDGRLQVNGSLERSGRLAFAAQTKLPAFHDAEAWRSLDERVLRSVSGRVDHFPLAALSEFGLMPEPLQGTASVELELGAALTQGHATVRVEGLRPNASLARFDLAASLELSPRAQTVTATLSTRGEPLVLTQARIDASLASLRAGGLDRSKLAAQLSVPRVPLESFFRRKKTPLGGHLVVDGEVSGTLAAPKAQVQVRIDGAKIGAQAFEAFGFDAQYAADQAKLDLGLREASGGKLDLTAQVASLSKAPKLEAALDASSLDLGFIGVLAHSVGGVALGIDGVLGGKLSLRGDVAAPAIEGDLRVEALKLVLPGEVPPLESATLATVFRPERYELDLSGKLGQGDVHLGAEALLRGMEHVDLTGKLTTEGVRVTAGSQIVALDTLVEVSGRRRGRDTNIEVVIGETLVDLPRGRGKRLRPIANLEDVRLVESFSDLDEAAKKKRTRPPLPPSGGTLSLSVKSPKPIIARGGENYLEINTDLELVLGPTKQSMKGEIGIDGRVNILRRRYDFRRGKISFPGPFPPDPRLDLRLGHDFDTMTLLVIVGGTAKKPDVRFASEPTGFDQAALLGIFLGAEPSAAGGKSAGQDTARAAASALASQLASKVGEDLPFDTIELDVGGGNRSMSITAGKWITDDIFVAYQYKFTPPSKTNENQGEGIVRWHFTRGWSLETRFGDRAAGSIDAIWLKRF